MAITENQPIFESRDSVSESRDVDSREPDHDQVFFDNSQGKPTGGQNVTSRADMNRTAHGTNINVSDDVRMLTENNDSDESASGSQGGEFEIQETEQTIEEEALGTTVSTESDDNTVQVPSVVGQPANTEPTTALNNQMNVSTENTNITENLTRPQESDNIMTESSSSEQREGRGELDVVVKPLKAIAEAFDEEQSNAAAATKEEKPQDVAASTEEQPDAATSSGQKKKSIDAVVKQKSSRDNTPEKSQKRLPVPRKRTKSSDRNRNRNNRARTTRLRRRRFQNEQRAQRARFEIQRRTSGNRRPQRLPRRDRRFHGNPVHANFHSRYDDLEAQQSLFNRDDLVAGAGSGGSRSGGRVGGGGGVGVGVGGGFGGGGGNLRRFSNSGRSFQSRSTPIFTGQGIYLARK